MTFTFEHIRVVKQHARPGKFIVRRYLSAEFDPPPITWLNIREFDDYETAIKYRNWCWSMPHCLNYYR